MSLSNSDIDQFISSGFTFVRDALSAEFIRKMWEPCREFMDHMRGYETETHIFFPRRQLPWDVKKEAPALDEAINQLIGGKYREVSSKMWGDGFVVAQPFERIAINSDNLLKVGYSWHIDGFHRHFLDSPEIGVVALIMWTDSSINNGATVLAGDSIKIIAQMLANKSDGFDGDFFDKNRVIDDHWKKKIRVEGKAGDVCLMHPFLMHSIQLNMSNEYRAVTNPVVALAEPMKFNRLDGSYSPVERAILNALNVESIDFLATGVRQITASTTLSNKFTYMRSDLKQQMENFFSKY